MHISLIYNILSLYFSDFCVLLKSQFCPSVVPQTLEGHNFLVPFCPSGTSGDKNAYFWGKKWWNTNICKYELAKKARSKPNVFVFSMVLFVKSLSPDNIFWKCCPTSIPNTHKMVIDNAFKSYFWGYSEIISEKLP